MLRRKRLKPPPVEPRAPVPRGVNAAALSIAVIIPVLNERGYLARQLKFFSSHADVQELIIVEPSDMPSNERDMLLAASALAPSGPLIQLLRSKAGRAQQMNRGAAAATTDILVFLHVDTMLPHSAFHHIRGAIAAGRTWGRFDVRLTGTHRWFRLIARAMNLRSMLSGIATGDQAIFVRRDIFNMIGGFAPIAIMEDIELSKRLKWTGRPACIQSAVLTSSRRWEQGGIVRTVILMWTLRLLYACGVPPRHLARWYR